MKSILINANRKEAIFVLVFILLILFLILLPTGFEKQIYRNSEGVRAKVISVDNTEIQETGLVKQGDQRGFIEIETGSHKGEQVEGVNLLTGKKEFDKIFQTGDTIWVLLELDENNDITFANMVDHYRLDRILLLIGLFAVLIILFSGFTGVRTLLSFIFALLSIWKILIPNMLRGYHPLIVALIIGNILTISTLLLVAGFTKKAYAAMIGAVSCSLITALLAMLFSYLLKIDGTVMQWSESLLYAGYMNLDLNAIFQASVYLACSGAILDLAIDISAALEEVIRNNPNISKKELVKSGINIGKSVVGSQTTTLLLAYMGSYITIMMVYMAQGTPIMNIINSKAIAAEILYTFVGCIGLILVSPITSLVSGFTFKKRNNDIIEKKV